MVAPSLRRDRQGPEGVAARPPRRWAAAGDDHRVGRRDRPRAARERRGRAGAWFVAAANSGSLERYLETFAHTVGGHADARGAASGGRRVRASTWPPTASSMPRSRFAPEQHLDARPARCPRWSTRCWPGSPTAARAAARAGHSIRIGTLLTAMRHAARSMEIAELAVRYRDSGVVGFDIAGAEAGYPPTRHLDAFEYLQRENFHFTIHAGEAFGLPCIWQAIQWCGADRLGHGVRIVDDIIRGRPARPARRLRPGQAHPAGALPVLQRADRRGRVDRRAPDRAAAGPAVPGHGQHRQSA